LIVWIIGKIINNSTLAKQNDNPKHSLEKSGIWNNKINNYMQFVKSHSLKKFISMQKSIYELDLSSKGLNKRNFWNDLDSLIINLTN
jgi:DNA polymerase III delta subunit